MANSLITLRTRLIASGAPIPQWVDKESRPEVAPIGRLSHLRTKYPRSTVSGFLQGPRVTLLLYIGRWLKFVEVSEAGHTTKRQLL
jgi:hypothetical protein